METSQRPNTEGGPPMVSMGTELGGRALARLLQQMWPVQGWRGVEGGAVLCLAAGPCLGRGRPEAGCGKEPVGAGPPPRGSPESQASGWHRALQATLLLPTCWAQPPQGTILTWASLKAPMFAKGGLPACEHRTDPTVLALALQPRTRPPQGRLGPVTAVSLFPRQDCPQCKLSPRRALKNPVSAEQR